MKHSAAQMRAVYVFTLALLCALLCACAAYATGGCAVYDFDEPVSAVVPYGDAFIAVVGDGLWLADEDAQALRLQAAPEGVVPQLLFTDDRGRLLALAQAGDDYVVYNIDIERDAFEDVCRIPRRGAPAGYISRVLWQDKHIIIVYQGDMPFKSDLLIYDTAGGGASMLWGCDAAGVAAYRGGEVLALRRQFGTDEACAVIAIDLATKAQRVLFTMTAFPEAFCYDAANERIIAFSAPGVALLSLSGELAEQRYLPCTDDSRAARLCAVNGARLLAVSDGRRLLAVHMDEAQDIRPLQIASFSGDRAETKRFRLSHPDVPVLTNNMGYRLTPAVVSRLIQGNDSATDIFMVRTFEVGYTALLNKGYCASLNESEHIRASVAGMLAPVAAAVTVGDDVLGVPVDMEFDPWAALECDTATLEQCGLSLDSIPSNLCDLLDRLIAWYEDGTPDGVRLFDIERDRQAFALIWFTLNNYTCHNALTGEWLDYDTPLFEALMDKCDRLRALIDRQDCADGAPFLFRYASPDLLLAEGRDTDMAFIPLAPQAGMEQRYPVYLTVAVMNPLSQSKEAVLAYLAAILDELPAITRLYLCPDTAAPTEQAGYEEERQAAADELARLQALLEDRSHGAEERGSAEELMNSAAERLAYLESEARWELSPEAIAAYRSFADSIVVPDSAVREMLDEPMIAMVEGYASGRIELAALKDALIRKARLIRMEQE